MKKNTITVEEFIRSGAITDTFVAEKLLNGELDIHSDIVKSTVTDTFLYDQYFGGECNCNCEEFTAEPDNTPEPVESVKAVEEIAEENASEYTLIIDYSAGDNVIKTLPASKVVKTKEYTVISEDLVEPVTTKKQKEVLGEFVGYTYNGELVTAGAVIPVTEDMTIEFVAKYEKLS